jgi:ribonuclease-3
MLILVYARGNLAALKREYSKNPSACFKDRVEGLTLNEASLQPHGLPPPIILRFDAIKGYSEKCNMSSSEKLSKSYQRCEFLGDRVLNLIVSQYLYEKFHEDPEGKLTEKLRFVSNDNLDEILDRLDSNFRDELARFKYRYKPDHPELSADDVEAFIGNYYLENGFEAVKKYFENLFEKEIDAFDPNTDYISRLQIYSQKKLKKVPEYKPVNKGMISNNEDNFHFRVFIGEDLLGEGSGSRKSKARKQAAFEALKTLGKL